MTSNILRALALTVVGLGFATGCRGISSEDDAAGVGDRRNEDNSGVQNRRPFRTAPEEENYAHPRAQQRYIDLHTDSKGTVHPEWDVRPSGQLAE